MGEVYLVLLASDMIAAKGSQSKSLHLVDLTERAGVSALKPMYSVLPDSDPQ